jgi:hypothetical protein
LPRIWRSATPMSRAGIGLDTLQVWTNTEQRGNGASRVYGWIPILPRLPARDVAKRGVMLPFHM